MAYSYALAQSTKLARFELRVDMLIDKTASIPRALESDGSTGLSSQALTKTLGSLFVQRCYVNLQSDFLDTPEVFWDFDDFEQMYKSMRDYQEIEKRLDILNQRLEILKELYKMLQNELNVNHFATLEWIIIILIAFEVVIELLKTAGAYFKWIPCDEAGLESF